MEIEYGEIETGKIEVGRIDSDPFYSFTPRDTTPPPPTESATYSQEPNMEFGQSSTNQGLSGITIYAQDLDAIPVFISAADIFGEAYKNADDPENWSVEFTVTGGISDLGNPAYVADSALFDEGSEAGETQTKARIPIIVGGNASSLYGTYRETTICVNGYPITLFNKIS